MNSRADGQDGPDDDLVDLDLHCVPDPDHCARMEDVHLDAVHLEDATT